MRKRRTIIVACLIFIILVLLFTILILVRRRNTYTDYVNVPTVSPRYDVSAVDNYYIAVTRSLSKHKDELAALGLSTDISKEQISYGKQGTITGVELYNSEGTPFQISMLFDEGYNEVSFSIEEIGDSCETEDFEE